MRHFTNSEIPGFPVSGPDQPVLVLASGADRVDEDRLTELVGPVERARADFVRARTGFAIGGVPPVGHSEPIETLMDEHLLDYDVVWAAAGTPRAVFSIGPRACGAHIGRSRRRRPCALTNSRAGSVARLAAKAVSQTRAFLNRVAATICHAQW